MTSLGTASAAPGEADTGRLSVGETRDGSPVGLPVRVINGAEEGKTLYIQAASDGDELNGIGVLRELVPRLDPADLAGTILLVGVVNMHAFRVAEHRNPIDDTKLNRAYPGDEHGTSSERLAAATFEIATGADLALDLHQGSTSRMIHETRVRCGPRHHLHSECLDLAKTFDCGHVLDQKGPDGQLARAAPDEGVPTIDPELGGSVGLDPESVTAGVEGIQNVLAAYGFLDGETDAQEQVRATGFEQYGAPAGGLVDFEAELGDRVEHGDSLFRVTDVFGSVKAETTADVEGVFWRTRRLPQVATGEYVCSVGTDVDTF
jgi:predicted deacylase